MISLRGPEQTSRDKNVRDRGHQGEPINPEWLARGIQRVRRGGHPGEAVDPAQEVLMIRMALAERQTHVLDKLPRPVFTSTSRLGGKSC